MLLPIILNWLLMCLSPVPLSKRVDISIRARLPGGAGAESPCIGDGMEYETMCINRLERGTEEEILNGME